MDTHRQKRVWEMNDFPVMKAQTAEERSSWIDILRGIAIIAVVLDHVMYMFPTLRSESLWHHTYFSVPWFIFLSGVANTHSAKRKEPQHFIPFYLGFLWRRSNILVAYLFASMVSYGVVHKGQIDSAELLTQLRLFSAQPTYYFINLLTQLYLIFPLLYWLLKRAHPRAVVAGTVLIAGAAWGLQVMGQPPWPFSPAGRLFGSIYLVVFWLGMVAGRFGIPTHWFVWFGALEVFVFTEWALNATQGYFLGLTPTVPFILWAMSLLIVVYLVLRVLRAAQLRIPHAWQSLKILGRYSVWIYLYHYLILLLLLQSMPQLPWLAALFGALLVGLAVPLVVGMAWRLLLIYHSALISRIIGIYRVAFKLKS